MANHDKTKLQNTKTLVEKEEKAREKNGKREKKTLLEQNEL